MGIEPTNLLHAMRSRGRFLTTDETQNMPLTRGFVIPAQTASYPCSATDRARIAHDGGIRPAPASVRIGSST